MLRYPFFMQAGGWLLVLLAGLMLRPVLRAQDVTVGPLNWYPDGPAPDELPKLTKVVKPDYPADMRKTAEVGYVVVLRYVDALGQNNAARMYPTHLPFERAVEASFYRWKIAPAKRQGTAVGSWTWVPILFNPHTAESESTDSVPRLLAIDLAILPLGMAEPGDSFFVPVTLSLNESGAIIQSKTEHSLDERAKVAVEAALKNWRLAPARRGGRAVAAEITLPVCCLSPWNKNAGEHVPPKALDLVQPDYPPIMAKFGIKGQVTMEFVIKPDGHDKNPVVVESDNPAFDEPALAALFKWKFAPGRIDGVKVNVVARQTIQFSMDNGGGNLFELRNRGDQSKLPPELRYDTPAKIRGVQIPVYPYEQLQNGIRGKVAATVLVDKTGRVASVKIRDTDRPEFGLAEVAALERFSFDPALKNGKPTQHLINFEQSFERVQLLDEDSERLLNWEKKHPERIVAANLLDLPLQPISTKPPLFPRDLRGKIDSGETTVEILIDEQGHAKLPRVISASEPAFGYAAVQAVSSWWFKPPYQEGKPVVTRVRVPVKFSSKSKSPATEAEETEPNQ